MEFERYTQLFPKGCCQMQKILALLWQDPALWNARERRRKHVFTLFFTPALSTSCSQRKKQQGSVVSAAHSAPYPAVIVPSATGEKNPLRWEGPNFQCSAGQQSSWDDTESGHAVWGIPGQSFTDMPGSIQKARLTEETWDKIQQPEVGETTW